MKQPRFTKGPWLARRDEAHFGSLSEIVGGELTEKWPNRRLIVQVGGSAPIEEQEANTRLMAAAPEMYEAIQEILRYPDEVMYPQGHRDALDMLRAARDKAVTSC